MHNPAIQPEKAVLVGLVTAKQDEDKSHDYLDELEFLLDTAGAIPDKRFVQKLPMPDPRTFVGAGKLAEIAEYVKAAKIDIVVFDDELSGSQTRNIERELGCRVLDLGHIDKLFSSPICRRCLFTVYLVR